ncbi:hypothetical protein CR513_05051, partial [Mucuna pruriens]
MEGVQEIVRLKSGKRPTSSSTKVSLAAAKKKNVNVKGPLDLHFFKKPKEIIQLGKNKRQTSINDACQKYGNEISFNVARSNSFKLMIEIIGNYGPHLKPPSYHELRVSLLKRVRIYKRFVKGPLGGTNEIWMLNHTNRKKRTLINFLVNCSLGTMFVKSIDVFEFMKTEDIVYQLLNSFVEEIGEKNIIQVVTNNGNYYVMVGKLLQATRTKLF